MKKLLHAPSFWLLVQAAILGVILYFANWFQPERSGDSELFEGVSAVSFTEYLSRPDLGTVPYGYPMFLRWVRGLSPTLDLLPQVQFLVHVLAVLIFGHGLKRLLGLPWLALAVASTLLYSNTFLLYGYRVMSDALGSSLAIAAVGALLVVVRNPRNLIAWAGLALFLFAACQVRSAYLFLLVGVPVLGLLLRVVALPPLARVGRWHWVGAGLAAATFLPFLTLTVVSRMLAEGTTGLAMGANGVYLIATQFLTAEMVSDLPPEVRPLAKKVLRRRRALAEGRVPPEVVRMLQGTPPDEQPPAVRAQELIDLVAGSESEAGVMRLLPGPTRVLHEQAVAFNVQFVVLRDTLIDFDPAAGHLPPTLARAVIRARLGSYLQHLGKMVGLGVLGATTNSYVGAFGIVLVLLVLASWPLLRASRNTHESTEAPRHVLYTLILLGSLFALGKIAVVCLVSVPVLRYIDAAGVFVPGIWMAVAFRLGSKS